MVGLRVRDGEVCELLVWIVQGVLCWVCKWLFGWPWHSAGFFFPSCAATRFIRCSVEDASARVWIGVPFSQPSGFRRRYEPGRFFMVV